MPKKSFFHDELGEIIVTKRRASRSIRLRVKPDSTIHVSMPLWLAYRHAINFVKEKQDWIKSQQAKVQLISLEEGLRVGKTHRIKLLPTKSESPKTRVVGNELRVYLPDGSDTNTPEVATLAEKAIKKLLKKQAAMLLPQRLQYVSEYSGYKYSSLRIGNMKTRWGSCNSNKQITLNCYLMQLPWELIDYVILHELVHTKVMSHGKVFWSELEKHLPNYKEVKKQLKDHSPSMHLA